MSQVVRLSEIAGGYAALVLDAYGVLVDGDGALPGARELIESLVDRNIPFMIATNDASRGPGTCAARFARLGVPIPAENIVTSGQLLAPHMLANGLAGARVGVLGTIDSRLYVEAGGGKIVEVAAGMEIDAVAVCDDAGFPFLRGCELILSAVIRALDAGRTPTLLLPNPDVTYPKSAGEYGLTAGAIALLIEAGLTRRVGTHAPKFVHLGKPERHLFDLACERLETRNVLMVGDQLETDVAGANAAGIDVALVDRESRYVARPGQPTPTFVIRDLG